MASSSSTSTPNPGMAEKSNHLHHQQPPLQCPRCNSSNTKFCYYNNYSLSQPRHFCKACKRYWTRGGTLRNVPVGGGYRRNKPLKRPPLRSGGDGALPAAQSPPPNPRMSNPAPPSNRAISNPLVYSLQTRDNLIDPLNFPFSSLSSGRVCGENPGFDFQPEVSGFGLGFSSGLVNPPSFGSSPSPFPPTADHNSVLFGSSAFGSSSTTASLLASTLHPLKFGSNGNVKDMISEAANGTLGSTPYERAQMLSSHENGVTATGNNKDVKVEGENGFGFGFGNSDPSLLWSTTNLGAWFDPSNSNMGSSVSSLL